MKTKELFLGAYNLKNVDALKYWLEIDSEKFIRGIDLAPSYGNSTEIMKYVGNQGYKFRNKLLYSYKIDVEYFTIQKGKWFHNFLQLLEISKLEQIDYLFVHWPWKSHIEEVVNFLEWLKVNAYVKKIGIANYGSLEESKQLLISSTIDIIQEEYHVLIPKTEKYNYKTFGYSPVANGKLYSSELYRQLLNTFKDDIIISNLNRRWLLERLDGLVFGTNKPDRISSWIDPKEPETEQYKLFESIVSKNTIKTRCFSPSLSMPV